MQDIDEYDRICKVEPFGRSLKTLKASAPPTQDPIRRARFSVDNCISSLMHRGPKPNLATFSSENHIDTGVEPSGPAISKEVVVRAEANCLEREWLDS